MTIVNIHWVVGMLLVSGSAHCLAQATFVQARAVGLCADTAGGSTGRAIAVDRHNNLYIAGEFSYSVAFDSLRFTTRINFYEPFIAKYDSNFNLQWAASPPGPRTAYGVTLDTAGNAFITGYMGPYAVFGDDTVWGHGGFDSYLVKYDPDGQMLWGRSDGGSDDEIAFAVATDRSGNAYVTGYFNATANFGSEGITSRGARDIFITKYNSDGTLLWVRSAGGARDDVGLSIAVDPHGNVYVTGYFEGTAVFGSDTVVSTVPATNNVFIVKYDSSGNYQWMRQPNGFTAAKGRSIAADDAGDVVVTGDFQGTAIFGTDTLLTQRVSDVFLAKLNADGTMLWARSGGGYGQDEGSGVAIDSLGNVVITGLLDVSPVIFGKDTLVHHGFDILIAKYRSNGDLQWAKAAGSIYQESSKGIAANTAGEIYIGGGFGTPDGVLHLDSVTVHGIPSRGSTLIAKLHEPQVSGGLPAMLSEEHGIAVYPNPSRGAFSLRWYNHTQGDATITITDLLGRAIYKRSFTREALQSAIDLTLQGVAPGMYVLQVSTANAVFSQRLVVE